MLIVNQVVKKEKYITKCASIKSLKNLNLERRNKRTQVQFAVVFI